MSVDETKKGNKMRKPRRWSGNRKDKKKQVENSLFSNPYNEEKREGNYNSASTDSDEKKDSDNCLLKGVVTDEEMFECYERGYKDTVESEYMLELRESQEVEQY